MGMGKAGRDGGARATTVLRRGKIWLVPAVLSALVTILLSLLYMGGILDPAAHLRALPIAIVNADQGKPPAGQTQNFGTQVEAAVTGGTGDDVRWEKVSEQEAQRLLAGGRVYGALLIPADFTSSVLALGADQGKSRPELLVLTNPGLGSLGSSMAAQINQRAAAKVSTAIGEQLLKAAPDRDPTARLLLAEPVQIKTRPGHEIGERSGLGLSAFYYTLLLVLIGFLSANIVHNGVDTALGYADSEVGPWHFRHKTVRIGRTQTLLAKMLMTAVLTAGLVSLLMFATITLLKMDSAHLPLLWIFSYCACLSLGLGVQAINAVFGGIGQIVAMFVFIALALPSSGASIPLEATPEFYRFLGEFEPMRQVSGGVRSILYFDAQAEAGLTRAWTMMAVGIIVALVLGFTMTEYYDRKGLHRMVPGESEDDPADDA
ncbi:YhgE/Pip domain-containing protein [Actinocorallia lasiicapitis]